MAKQYVKRNADDWEWARFGTFVSKLVHCPILGCWLYTGHVDDQGYGLYRGVAAHRLAWELFEGPIPAKMTVDHLCPRKNCVAPAHLEVVTNAENAGRALRRRMAQATLFQWSCVEPDYSNSIV